MSISNIHDNAQIIDNSQISLGTKNTRNESMLLEANLQESVRAAGSQIMIGEHSNIQIPQVQTKQSIRDKFASPVEVPSSTVLVESIDDQQSARDEADSIIQKYNKEALLPGMDFQFKKQPVDDKKQKMETKPHLQPISSNDIRSKQNIQTPKINQAEKEMPDTNISLIPFARNRKDQDYYVTFMLDCDTKFGEFVVLVGSLPEMGEWLDFTKVKMQWTDSQQWVTVEPVKISAQTPKTFQYKYVIVNYRGDLIKWEEGVNRIADLDLIKEIDVKQAQQMSQKLYSSSSDKINKANQKSFERGRHIQQKDIWQHFTIQFSVFYPGESGDEIFFKGEKKQQAFSDYSRCISSSAEPEPHAMHKSEQKEEWIQEKYWQKIQPWKSPLIKVQMSDVALNEPIRYQYSLKNQKLQIDVRERHFNRKIQFGDPDEYQSQLSTQGNDEQKNSERVFIVNGHVNKVDANFNRGFIVSKVPNTNIYLGSYPATDFDIDSLKKIGITAVLDVMTEDNVEQQNIHHLKMQKVLKENAQIQTYINYPIDEFNGSGRQGQVDRVFEGAQKLNDLLEAKNDDKAFYQGNVKEVEDELLENVNPLQALARKRKNGPKVFVMCSSGISRAPTIVLAYLTLFKKIACWKELHKSDLLLRQCHSLGFPNLPLIQKMAKDYKTFQESQKDEFQNAKFKKQLIDEVKERERLVIEQKYRTEYLERLRKDEEQRKQVEEERLKLLKLQERQAQEKLKYQESVQLKQFEDLKRQQEYEALQKAEELKTEELRLAQLAAEQENKRRTENEQAERLRAIEIQKLVEMKNIQEIERESQEQMKKKLEMESIKLKRLQQEAEMEAARLRQMQLDEAKRLAALKREQQKQQKPKGGQKAVDINMFHQPLSANGSMITINDEIDQHCDELFFEAPIKFRPRKNNKLDSGIKQIVDENDVKIPIVHIKDNLYLIGSSRKLCDLKGEHITIRQGGGYEPLEEYLPQKDRFYQRKLVTDMLNSNQSLEWVISQHIQAKRIPNTSAYTSSPARELPDKKKSSISSYNKQKMSMSSRSSSRSPSTNYNRPSTVSNKVGMYSNSISGSRSRLGIPNLRASPSTRQSMVVDSYGLRTSDIQKTPITTYDKKIINTTKKKSSSPFEAQKARTIEALQDDGPQQKYENDLISNKRKPVVVSLDLDVNESPDEELSPDYEVQKLSLDQYQVRDEEIQFNQYSQFN